VKKRMKVSPVRFLRLDLGATVREQMRKEDARVCSETEYIVKTLEGLCRMDDSRKFTTASMLSQSYAKA
jgi:hypothetical protein